MKEYKQIRSIMTKERITQVLRFLPDRFSAKQFSFFFVLCFPAEKAKIIANVVEKGKLEFETYLDRYYLSSLKRNNVLSCMKKGSVDEIRWTKDINYKKFKIIV